MIRLLSERDPFKQLLEAACYSITLPLDLIGRRLRARANGVDVKIDSQDKIEIAFAERLMAAEKEHQQKLIEIAAWYREQRLARDGTG